MLNKEKFLDQKRVHKFSKYPFILTMVFFYLPLLVLVIFSFNVSKSTKWDGISLIWYKKLIFNSSDLWRAFLNTVIIAFSSAVISTVIGTLGAIGLYWYKFKIKKYVQTISYLPLVLPEIIIGVSLLMFFARMNINLGLHTVLIAHVTFNLPYVIFIVMARLAEFDYSVIEAAYDLGARERDALIRVIIPMCMPGIISAFLIAVTLSLDDFVITFFVTGPGAATLPIHIYSMIRFGVSPVINALSVVLLAGSIILAFTSKKMYKYMFS